MNKVSKALGLIVIAGAVCTIAVPLTAAPGFSATRERVVEHWNSERRNAAIPRDLLIDPRGRGFLRGPGGTLTPYGKDMTPRARPPGAGGGGSSDNNPPTISDMYPNLITIGASDTFSATVTDDSGVKSVSFTIEYPNGVTTQTFNPGKSGDMWSIDLQGFTNGEWRWWVTAKDASGKGGNTGTSAPVDFTVDTGDGSSEPPAPGAITNAEWLGGGAVQTAAGRIYFEMPKNAKRKGPWQGYVCSGTVVADAVGGRSVVMTAAHCVYDDVNEAFARNVLFIPDQAHTSPGSVTDLNCDNDPLGCWVPSYGVVDVKWTTSVFPNNIAWDYAFYVVNDTGMHSQHEDLNVDDALDVAAGSLLVDFLPPALNDGVAGSGDDYTHALGYSYSEDPKFMYCAEDMTTEGAVNWWLPSCGLSGGSSGGPWMQPIDSGNGPVISVNSWGYTGSPGMAGPILSGTSAQCVFDEARLGVEPTSSNDGDAGTAVAILVDESGCMLAP